MRCSRAVWGVFVIGVLCSLSASAAAQPKGAKPAKAAEKADAEKGDAKKGDAKKGDAKKGDAKDEVAAGKEAEGRGERKTGEAEKTDSKVVDAKEDEEGVKTFKFGTLEVEGRLRSPQILYFLRRVRAEFDARGLGHRSFLKELNMTRFRPALK